jgi:predicted butyrate kinase (DUF1464 family)
LPKDYPLRANKKWVLEVLLVQKVIFTGLFGDVMDLSSFDVASLVAISGLIVTVVKLFLDQRKAKRDIELSKRGLEILSRLVEAYRKGQESVQQLEKEKLDLEKWKAIAKAAGWVLDRLEPED